MIQGPFFNPVLAGLAINFQGNGGSNTFAMATLDNGWAAVELARDTRDYKSIWINWSSVASPGTVELRIETVDATTLKPTGTLYDASATKTFTPTAGWQNVQFAALPTAGRTVGTLYAIVLVTTVAGTTQTLRSYIASSIPGDYPAVTYTGSSVATRSNFAFSGGSGSVPIFTAVMEDSVEEYSGSPIATHTTYTIFGTKALANKFIVPATLKVDGVYTYIAIGTAASLTGDLRLTILNSAFSIVSGSDVTLSKKHWGVDFNIRSCYIPFNSLITLTPDTYYFVLRNTDTGSTSGAAYSVAYVQYRSSAVTPGSFYSTTTTDITAGTPTWVDDNASVSNIYPSVLDVPVSAANVMAFIRRGGLSCRL